MTLFYVSYHYLVGGKVSNVVVLLLPLGHPSMENKACCTVKSCENFLQWQTNNDKPILLVNATYFFYRFLGFFQVFKNIKKERMMEYATSEWTLLSARSHNVYGFTGARCDQLLILPQRSRWKDVYANIFHIEPPC